MHSRAGSGDTLLTGATGLVGGAVLAELLTRPGGGDVICLVRGGDSAVARTRVEASLATWLDGGALDRLRPRVRIVLGDVLSDGLGLEPQQRREVVNRVDYIVHCAASVRFDSPLDVARAVNTEGAARILGLAEDATTRGRLSRAVLVSTAFVAGTTDRRFSEHELERGQSFRTTYEQSKFEAELLGREAMSRVPLTVVRPSIVVGHSQTGRTPAFTALYAPLRLMLGWGGTLTLPVRSDLPLDVVPVDWAARLIVEAMILGDAGQTYAAASGCASLTARHVAAVAGEVFGTAPPVLLPAGTSDEVVDELVATWQGRLHGHSRMLMRVYAPYLRGAAEFDAWRGDHLMHRAGVARFDPRTSLVRCLEYARATDFGRLRRRERRRAA